MKKIVHTTNAPAAIGPYSQAISFNGLLFISGQIPLNPETGKLIDSSIQEATHQVMKNLKAILNAEGLNFNHVLKTTIFLTDMSDFPEVNSVYASYFEIENYPARETVAVKELPMGVSVEISMIAYKAI